MSMTRRQLLFDSYIGLGGLALGLFAVLISFVAMRSFRKTLE